MRRTTSMVPVLALGSLPFLPGIAFAATCTASIGNVSFGSVDTLSPAVVDVTATIQISCSSVALGIVTVCPDIFAGSGGASGGVRLMSGPGTTKLSYQLYQNAGRTVVWGSGSESPPITFTTALFGSGSTTRTLYARVFGGQSSVEAGSHSSVFDTTQTSFRYGEVSLLDCALSLVGGVTHPTFNVSATVPSNCKVDAENIDFGSAGVLDGNVDAEGNVAVTCTPGLAYSVGLNGGLSNAPPTARLMTSGAKSITYGLYKDSARADPWGDGGSLDIDGSGDGSATDYPVYGRVPPQQTPAPGLYSDTIAVTVTYF